MKVFHTQMKSIKQILSLSGKIQCEITQCRNKKLFHSKMRLTPGTPRHLREVHSYLSRKQSHQIVKYQLET